MLRLLPLVMATVATASGAITGLGAAAQGNNTSDGIVTSGGLGGQAAVYAGGQPGVLSTGMVAVQWPTQVMLDGRLQILAPDYSVLTIEPGGFVLSAGQIYGDPAALFAVGYPQDLLSATSAVTTAPTLPLGTPAPTAASLLPSTSLRPNASQILATVAPPQAQDDGRKTLDFKPIAGTVFDYGSAVNRPMTSTASASSRSSSSLSSSLSARSPRSMPFAPPGFAVPGYQARDGAYYVAGPGRLHDQGGAAADDMLSADQGRNTFSPGSTVSSSAVFEPMPATTATAFVAPSPAFSSAPSSLSNGVGVLTIPAANAGGGERVTASADDPQGIFAGIQQAVADTPWFVWAGAGATAAGVAYVVLTNGD